MAGPIHGRKFTPAANDAAHASTRLRLLATQPGFQAEHVLTARIIIFSRTLTVPVQRAGAFGSAVSRMWIVRPDL